MLTRQRSIPVRYRPRRSQANENPSSQGSLVHGLPPRFRPRSELVFGPQAALDRVQVGAARGGGAEPRRSLRFRLRRLRSHGQVNTGRGLLRDFACADCVCAGQRGVSSARRAHMYKESHMVLMVLTAFDLRGWLGSCVSCATCAVMRLDAVRDRSATCPRCCAAMGAGSWAASWFGRRCANRAVSGSLMTHNDALVTRFRTFREASFCVSYCRIDSYGNGSASATPAVVTRGHLGPNVCPMLCWRPSPTTVTRRATAPASRAAIAFG